MIFFYKYRMYNLKNIVELQNITFESKSKCFQIKGMLLFDIEKAEILFRVLLISNTSINIPVNSFD